MSVRVRYTSSIKEGWGEGRYLMAEPQPKKVVTRSEPTKTGRNLGFGAWLITLIVVILIGYLTGFLGSGALKLESLPASAEVADLVKFGSWLVAVGLVLIGLALPISVGVELAKLSIETKQKAEDEDGEEVELQLQEVAAASATAATLTSDLIKSSSDLVKTPAGIGAFVMLVGTIIIVGAAFAA